MYSYRYYTCCMWSILSTCGFRHITSSGRSKINCECVGMRWWSYLYLGQVGRRYKSRSVWGVFIIYISNGCCIEVNQWITKEELSECDLARHDETCSILNWFCRMAEWNVQFLGAHYIKRFSFYLFCNKVINWRQHTLLSMLIRNDWWRLVIQVWFTLINIHERVTQYCFFN